MKNKHTKSFVFAVALILLIAAAVSIWQVKTKDSPISDSQSDTSAQNTDGAGTSDITVLVNSENPLPDDWSVSLIEISNNQYADSRAYEALNKMLSDCAAAGYSPLVCSSYRTWEKQTELYNNKVQKYLNAGYSKSAAEAEAAKWVAPPGTSEHQTGLAFDIVSVSNQVLDETQLDSACQQWLMRHCYEYGFILRYPEDKTDITKIDFEPWHYRYVGTAAAKVIYNENLCLEEYHELYIK